MAGASIRFPVAPRMVPPEKVARWLHLTMDEFRTDLPALRMEGFPQACPVTGNYDLKALEAWQDRRSGLVAHGRKADAAATINARLSAFDG